MTGWLRGIPEPNGVSDPNARFSHWIANRLLFRTPNGTSSTVDRKRRTIANDGDPSVSQLKCPLVTPF
ncbi:MAG TPA: hypothetical protein VFU37_06130 [Pyrinomonadaceae bacterium]|nr:hypothetical protein [Pyrinomonadaceae bacterium]